MSEAALAALEARVRFLECAMQRIANYASESARETDATGMVLPIRMKRKRVVEEIVVISQDDIETSDEADDEEEEAAEPPPPRIDTVDDLRALVAGERAEYFQARVWPALSAACRSASSRDDLITALRDEAFLLLPIFVTRTQRECVLCTRLIEPRKGCVPTSANAASRLDDVILCPSCASKIAPIVRLFVLLRDLKRLREIRESHLARFRDIERHLD